MGRCLEHVSKMNKLKKKQQKKPQMAKKALWIHLNSLKKDSGTLSVLQKLPSSKSHNTATVDL